MCVSGRPGHVCVCVSRRPGHVCVGIHATGISDRACVWGESIFLFFYAAVVNSSICC